MTIEHATTRMPFRDRINVFVGNLSLDMTEAELKQEFMPYGEIISASLMNDRYIGSGQSAGYGYVAMAVRTQGEAAITGLNGKMWHSRAVNILEALPLSPPNPKTAFKSHFRQRTEAPNKPL